MMSESGEKTHAYPKEYMQIPGEENVHSKDASMRKGVSKAPHGFGHTGSQRAGPLRMSGVKGAHRIGGRRGG